MNNPIISVIMGTYNCADTVKNAIDSVVAQTFEDWEFIICDDCSTDNTYHVLKEIAEGDKRIKIVRNESNKKLAYTLNHCLEIAKGKYIARMDADDICFPDRLSKQVKFLDQHKEYAVVGGGIIPYDDSGEHKATQGSPSSTLTSSMASTLPVAIQSSMIESFASSPTAMRTSRE